MFVQTETTPNPDSMRFFPGFTIMDAGKTAYFADKQRTSNSPLADAILKIDDIIAVFFCDDFITVTKNSTVKWAGLLSDIMRVISIYCTKDSEGKRPNIFKDNDIHLEGSNVSNSIGNTSSVESIQTSITIESEEDSEIVLKIKKIIDERIRPAIMQDGGNLVFIKYENNIVYVTFEGACVGCPSSAITLKQGIESMLKYYIDEIESVEQVLV